MNTLGVQTIGHEVPNNKEWIKFDEKWQVTKIPDIKTPLDDCMISLPKAHFMNQLLDDKDSLNTGKATKGCKILFEQYLKEKQLQAPTTAE